MIYVVLVILVSKMRWHTTNYVFVFLKKVSTIFFLSKNVPHSVSYFHIFSAHLTVCKELMDFPISNNLPN